MRRPRARQQGRPTAQGKPPSNDYHEFIEGRVANLFLASVSMASRVSSLASLLSVSFCSVALLARACMLSVDCGSFK